MNNEWHILVTLEELKNKTLPHVVMRRDQKFSIAKVDFNTNSFEVSMNGQPFSQLISDGDCIWFCTGDQPKAFKAYWPTTNKNYNYCELRSIVRSDVPYILENFIDSTHTGYVHGGILRGEPVQAVQVNVSSTDRGILVSTEGEKMATASITKLFNRQNDSVVHTDELILPHTVRVEYKFGPVKHVIAVSICVPLENGFTKIYTRVYLHWPIFQPLVLAYLKYSTRVILNQDKVILEDQSANVQRYGNDFKLRVAADASALAIRRAWNNFITNGSVEKMRPIQFNLKI